MSEKAGYRIQREIFKRRNRGAAPLALLKINTVYLPRLYGMWLFSVTPSGLNEHSHRQDYTGMQKTLFTSCQRQLLNLSHFNLSSYVLHQAGDLPEVIQTYQ
jgi:hypothetical protein